MTAWIERVVQCERSSCLMWLFTWTKFVLRVNQVCFEGLVVVFCVPKKILGAVGGIKKREMSTLEERLLQQAPPPRPLFYSLTIRTTAKSKQQPPNHHLIRQCPFLDVSIHNLPCRRRRNSHSKLINNRRDDGSNSKRRKLDWHLCRQYDGIIISNPTEK